MSKCIYELVIYTLKFDEYKIELNISNRSLKNVFNLIGARDLVQIIKNALLSYELLNYYEFVIEHISRSSI